LSTIEPRKNLPFLVDLFENMADFDGELVICGQPGWKYEPILDRIRASKRAGAIRLLGHMDDADLPALYTGADLFLCSSFYEGFGFPPLEAMACGTPVLSSAGGSLAEVLGDAAVVRQDFDPEGWLADAQRLLSGSALRAELRQRGLMQAAQYRWEKTAQQTFAVYRELLGAPSRP
jgi:glycosyltransferase involved in cell wall biosynthesis